MLGAEERTRQKKFIIIISLSQTDKNIITITHLIHISYTFRSSTSNIAK